MSFLETKFVYSMNYLLKMCCNVFILNLSLTYNIFFVSCANLYNGDDEGIHHELKLGFPTATKDQRLPDDSALWNNGIVPYYVDTEIYDSTLTKRLRSVMSRIEGSSCIVFKRLASVPLAYKGSWLHFTNPSQETDCVHKTKAKEDGEIVMVLGFQCLKQKEILHSVLHSLGFKDEVSHPQRDLYIKILWENIQPKYRSLFRIQSHKQLAEYDPMSVMHFHDRAFSANGGATIAPVISGLQISPSDSLSLLDMMKLRLYFGHECKKRKVNDLLDTCKDVLHDDIKNEKNNLKNMTDIELNGKDGTSTVEINDNKNIKDAVDESDKANENDMTDERNYDQSQLNIKENKKESTNNNNESNASSD